MASSRAPARRGAPPSHITSQPKPTISVEAWEAKAPLGELETRSIAALKAASERTPLPSKFSSDEAGPSSRPDTPLAAVQRNLRGTGGAPSNSRPGTPLAGSRSAGLATHALHPKQPIQTPQQFYDWFALIDRSVALLEVTDEIGARLEYFQELEHATRMLNHPGESLVLQTDFLYMVERVDICIDYLKAHRHFREAEIYLFRYQQCMTRAMTLIKMYFVGSLRALSVDVSKRLSEKDVSPTAQMHLLYTRFNTVSTQLLPLLSELERRARSHPQELSALLQECHTAYFSARKSLLVGRIMEEIRGLDPTRTDQYLENLCDHLYDDLRPRILHEPRLTALCEVCTVLQALMVLDVSSVQDDSDDDFESSSQEKQDTWYPTLRKTVWVLSQLHDFVKAAIFEDIAQEAISLCRQSLVAAADVMRVKAPLDAQLFLVRHLLLLKEITQNLDLAQREGQASGSGSGTADAGGVTDTLALMLSKTTSLLPDALFASLGMPRAEETITEAKHGIDHELRRGCEAVIALCTDPITQPLHEWTVTPAFSHTAANLPSKPKPAARDVATEFERACTTELRAHAGRVRLYLEDARTVTARVLLEHVRERVGDAYEAFWEAAGSGRGPGEELASVPVVRRLLVDACV
ncbi:hypothetical protein DXG03_003723 [Asterophora parasitica]|uniref:Conserved oligomeric Golgi complex subunit 3 n=1 Tax=Asterophora parasitica TaxID=117018 RepID=A0A9P7G7E2_9AGAR|nr:hypothetical protein DXG03_003723 [Asterophora parasitica]